jgi:AcrR family transcriptional regulator
MSPRSKEMNRQMRENATVAILAGAVEVFTEKGFHAATTAEIAARAGVSKGLVFSYFRSKDDLLRAVLEDRMATVFRDLSSLPPPEAGRQMLEAVVEIWPRYALEHAELHRLYLSLLLQPGATPAIAEAAAALKPQIERFYGAFATAFRVAGSADPVADAMLFNAALNGILLTLVAQPSAAAEPNSYPLAAMQARLLASLLPASAE